MKIDELAQIKSDSVLNKDLQGIDFQGFEVFKKENNLLDSKLFGIELKYIGIIAFIIWLVKK